MNTQINEQGSQTNMLMNPNKQGYIKSLIRADMEKGEA
jgi:hypothetical protein